ncbi:MAG: right-handed parallel beta-helix repeat-containing protein, partial [Thermoguttaceae bacterium]|nr:right-handed parallel beta-helix repeat-containing protein [Thermoguttaceae bacterium]
LAHAIAIVGETGDPQDAIIVVGPNEYLVIQSSNVFFKGIAFEIDANSNEQPSESAVKVELLGDVLFIDCAFQGNRSVESSGVLINEGNAKFWNCVFKEFGGAGIVAQNEGSGTAAYCKFSDSNVGIKVLAKGTLDASACFFSNNGIGFDAQDNGGGSVKSNLFDANQNAWNVDYKSRGSLDFDKKTNIVDKK